MTKKGRFGDARSALNASIISQQNGAYEKSLAAVLEALRLDPSVGDAHYQHGCVLVRLGRLDEAAEAVKRAAEVDPATIGPMRHDDDLAPVRQHPALGRLLMSPKTPRALPKSVDDAVALLVKAGVKLPPPSRASGKAPPALQPFFALASRLPSNAIQSVGELPRLSRKLARDLARAEADGDLGDGLDRALFSDAKQLIAIGEAGNGGLYFLDPRHGEFVFQLAHDETELCVETATLGAFVAREGLRGLLPDDDFVKLLMSSQRAARTALKAARGK
ncbi:MAG: hypothetical protein ACOZQL_35150 [Myxococcota bacterium]